MTSATARVGVCGLFAMLCAQPVAAQDDQFRRGMTALDDEEWTEAVKQLQEAIRLNPKESTRRIGGRFGIGGNPYLPYFRLGQALLELEDCAGALKAWEESERQGVVKKLEDELEEIQEGYEHCEEEGFLTLEKFASEMQRAGTLLKEATAIEQDVAAIRAKHADLTTQELRTQYERARADLGGARDRLAAAERNRRTQAMADAVTAAENARRTLAGARTSLERAIDGGLQFSARLIDVEGLVEGADRTAQTISALTASSPVKLGLSPSTTDARQRADESLRGARGKLDAARRTRADADLADARRLALDAQAGLTRVHAELQQLRAATIEGELRSLRASAGGAFSAADARVADVRGSLAARPAAPEVSQRVTAGLKTAQTTLARARRQFDQAVGAGDIASARSATRLIADVNGQLDSLAPLLGGAEIQKVIPEVLKRAAQLFFEGRYGDVLASLTEDASRPLQTSLRVHAHALRAASFFALYESRDGRGESLRASARQEVDACKRLDPSFQPNPAAFAPKFLSFFSGTQAASR